MKELSFGFLVILLAAAGCFGQAGIRDVDFENFTYEAGICGGENGERISVRDGEFSREKMVDGYPDRTYFSVFGLTFGDLDKDGNEEAAIMSVCNTGGSGNFSEAYIYTMRDEKPVRVLTYGGGDRAFGGLKQIRIENGIFIVESYDPGDIEAACCPELVITNKYRLKGTMLEGVGKPEKRELFPAVRIEFGSGATTARIEVILDNDAGIKRFVLSARNGQKLTVTSASDEVRFRLIKGEAEIIEEDRELVADLTETGDFVFEIRAYAENELRTSIIVTIK